MGLEELLYVEKEFEVILSMRIMHQLRRANVKGLISLSG